MKNYKVVIVTDAKEDLRRILDYLRNIKQSKQAASNVMSDFRETIKTLSIAADSLKLSDNSKLTERGLKRINFKRHNYFMIYYTEENTVFVTNIFHSLEDYENKIK